MSCSPPYFVLFLPELDGKCGMVAYETSCRGTGKAVSAKLPSPDPHIIASRGLRKALGICCSKNWTASVAPLKAVKFSSRALESSMFTFTTTVENEKTLPEEIPDFTRYNKR